jgi:hypothetical protein
MKKKKPIFSIVKGISLSLILTDFSASLLQTAAVGLVAKRDSLEARVGLVGTRFMGGWWRGK